MVFPPSQIKTETFDSGGSRKKGSIEAQLEGLDPTAAVNVTFAKSGVTVIWRREKGTLLEVAEAAGVTAPSDCRTGLCGTCVTRILEGEVVHLALDGAEPEAAEALLCCAVPTTTSLVVDL